MLKLKTYLKYKFALQINKKLYSLFLVIFILIVGGYTNSLIHKHPEAELLPIIRIIIVALIICSIIYSSIMTIKFINSKEFIFLTQFSLSKIDKISIICFNLIPYNLIFLFFYNIIMISFYKKSFDKSIFIITSSMLIVSIMVVSAVTIAIILRKIKFTELRIIFIISFFYYLIRLCLNDIEYKYVFTKEFLIYIGNLNISINLYNNFFYPCANEIIKLLLLLLFITIICYYNSNFNNLGVDYSIFNKVKFFSNKSIKKKQPIVGFFIKDMLLLNRNYIYIIVEISTVLLMVIGILQISKINSIFIFIICSIYSWIFSCISSDLFKFEVDQIWLIKSLPISNKNFLKYKLLNSYFNAVKGSNILLIISLLTNKVTLLVFFAYLLLVQLVAIIFCFICSSIIYIVFPKITNGNIPVFIITIGIAIFPPVIILVLIISLIIVNRKIRSSGI